MNSVPDVEPMTWTLLGRFFGLPLLIIGTIVGGAVVVVLLFGGPSAPEKVSIDQLLQALEASSGEKSAGILLPREKRLWQQAVELSERLRNKDSELTPEELKTTASRLTSMILADLDAHKGGAERVASSDRHKELRSSRVEFLIRALGRTELPEALATLIEIVERNEEPYASAAMLQLGELRDVQGVNAAVPAMTKVLRESNRAESLIVAATAVSLLAQPGDSDVIGELSDLCVSRDDEVAWSAALGLARLQSDAGKSTLLDLLDRSFWETGNRYSVTDENGAVHRYPMPPSRVDAYLKAAIDAGSELANPEVWAMIEELASDRSPTVRGSAKAVLSARGKVGAG